MKKILIFSIAYSPHVGGAEIAVREITDRLSFLGWDMITLRFKKKEKKFEKIGNVNVYRIDGPKFLFPILSYLKARQLHKKNNYDLIWSIMAAYAGFGSLFFGCYSRLPFLLTLQEGDSEKHILRRVGIFYFLWKQIFKKANYIQVISNYLADFARRYGANCPIEVVPNGVDMNKFKFKIENLKTKNEIILITTSRLVKKNAVGDIVEALKYLPENVKLLIFGSGSEEEKLKSKIKNLKLENRISLNGYVGHDDLPRYLAEADIFIRPSLSEGFGNSFIEAMAVGVPVVATRVGGIVDFLHDPQKCPGQVPTGLFCEVRDPKSIAEKVEIYMKNEDLRNKIIDNAREMVVKKYDWNLIAQKMQKIFERL